MTMEKIKPKFLMMNDTTNDEKEVVYMHGVVGRGWFGDISAKGVRELLDNVTAKEIEVHIHSNGGDAFEGVAICNYLRNHSATITVVIDGMCASAASLIAMGADKVIMPSNTTMMVHRASTYAYGNADSLEKSAKMLRDVDAALIQTYKARFNGEFFELEELLDNETYMTAETAKSYGLCDEIIEPVQNVSNAEDDDKKGAGTNEDGENGDGNSENDEEGKENQVQNAERAMRFINALMESTKL
ncbi:head maturation protease, ClpP-related [Bacillus albus]|uniref:head maturation protease, ClpP-related n=1 Tax=Bacillus albus TaxID=2026189 RepID=UPI0010220268|nr:head maturation protease, ClpP-related [Bacillus albus]